MYFFHIIAEYYFVIEEAIRNWVEEINNEINSVKNKSMFNKRRLSGSKGRWQKAISVRPSRAGPLARSNI